MSAGFNASINCATYEESGYLVEFIGLPPGVDLALSTILVAVGAVAVCGNALAFYYFLVITKKEQPIVKPLYLHLTVMDFIMGCLTIAYSKTLDMGRFKIMCMVSEPYNWAWEMLQISGAFFGNVPMIILNVFASISLLRLYAVMRPFNYRYIKRKGVYLIIGLCYLVPFIYAFLPVWALMNKTRIRYSYNALYGYAYLDQTIMKLTKATDFTFKMFVVILPLFVPALAILISTSLVFRSIVKRSQQFNTASGNANPTNLGPAKTMLIMGTSVFLTKIPIIFITIYDILQTFNVIDTYDTGTPLISFADFYVFFPAAWSVDCLSSALNPFIYHIRSNTLFESVRQNTGSYNPEVTQMSVMERSVRHNNFVTSPIPSRAENGTKVEFVQTPTVMDIDSEIN